MAGCCSSRCPIFVQGRKKEERQHFTVSTQKALPPCNRPFVLVREKEELQCLLSQLSLKSQGNELGMGGRSVSLNVWEL